MAVFNLMRVDNRLIHGQVMTMWSKEKNIEHILVVDDPLSKDEFLQKVYMMAVPSHLKVTVLSIEDAANAHKNDEYENSNYLLLVKDIQTASNLWKAGFPMESLQIGNVVSEEGSKMLHKNTRLSEEHLPLLKEMYEGGVDVYIQSVPTERATSIKEYI